MISPQKFLKLVQSWEARPRRNSVAHRKRKSLFQRRKTFAVVPKCPVGNSEGSFASSDRMAAAGDSKSAAKAKSLCNSMRETFWKGSPDAGLFAIEQQLKSRFECSAHLGREEGWACWERLLSKGQQLWREGEGSGLGAGEAPAGTTTAARDWMPVHAMTRWLTDHTKSATIKTTPVDRLLDITRVSLRPRLASCCDFHHTAQKTSNDFYRRTFAACVSPWN